jgi:hypothetical protein
LTDDRRVVCLSKKNQELYVDAYGKVWPCCWIGDSAMPRRSSMDREWFYRTIVKKYGKDFNDLNKKSLTEILNSSWYRGDLIDSTDRNFSDPQNPHQPKCSHKCSVRARPQWATRQGWWCSYSKTGLLEVAWVVDGKCEIKTIEKLKLFVSEMAKASD